MHTQACRHRHFVCNTVFFLPLTDSSVLVLSHWQFLFSLTDSSCSLSLPVLVVSHWQFLFSLPVLVVSHWQFLFSLTDSSSCLSLTALVLSASSSCLSLTVLVLSASSSCLSMPVLVLSASSSCLSQTVLVQWKGWSPSCFHSIYNPSYFGSHLHSPFNNNNT